MTGFWALDLLCLAAIVVTAVLAVFQRNLNGSVMALSAMGTVLALLFVVLAAPDVALAEIVVGTVAMPVLYLIAIGKLRTVVRDSGELGDPRPSSSNREDPR
ncbi:Na(+)/H(+) antiporter subunit B [Monashia sp. NPDC004114]